MPTNITTRIEKDTIQNMYIKINSNLSWANLYLLPQKSESAVVLDVWHHPAKKYELHNLKFMEILITREYYIKRSSEYIPCTDISEDLFYKVSEDLPLNQTMTVQDDNLNFALLLLTSILELSHIARLLW